jgi:hypothetical protein
MGLEQISLWVVEIVFVIFVVVFLLMEADMNYLERVNFPLYVYDII